MSIAEEKNQSFIPDDVKGYSLAPTTTIYHRARQAGEGSVASIVILILAAVVLYLATIYIPLPPSDAIGYWILVLLTQVGKVVFARSRRPS